MHPSLTLVLFRQDEIRVLQDQRRALLKERPAVYLAAKHQVGTKYGSAGTATVFDERGVGVVTSATISHADAGANCDNEWTHFNVIQKTQVSMKTYGRTHTSLNTFLSNVQYFNYYEYHHRPQSNIGL